MVIPTNKPLAKAPSVGRVLVVDDESMNRVVLAGMLSRHGYVAAQAVNGTDALKLVDQGDIELVLLDIVMPEMDGFDVLDRFAGAIYSRRAPGHYGDRRQRSIADH